MTTGTLIFTQQLAIYQFQLPLLIIDTSWKADVTVGHPTLDIVLRLKPHQIFFFP